jgi:hypothetical protein
MGFRWIIGGFYCPSLHGVLRGFAFWLVLYPGIDVLCLLLGMGYIWRKRQTILHEQKEISRSTKDHRISKTYKFLIGRKFCSTSRGYVGWIPSTAQSGDEICFLNGCRLLFIIRGKGDEPDQKDVYRLLGDCYIHGLMQQDISNSIDAETREIVLT